MYHDYNSGWAKAETWNKGGCSEVWAKINYNGTDTAWQVDTRTARASVSGGHISFQGSVGMARLLGGGLSPANDFF
jgi:hypothetical protein